MFYEEAGVVRGFRHLLALFCLVAVSFLLVLHVLLLSLRGRLLIFRV